MLTTPFSNSSHYFCFICPSAVSLSIATALLISTIFFLPLFLFVFFVGYQQWKKRRLVSSLLTASHSDILTFHMAFLEIISFFGLLLYIFASYAKRPLFVLVGIYILSMLAPGRMLFHLFTCVDRYLAVVHPVHYRGLKQAGGVRIRNISIWCVWLLCFGLLSLQQINEKLYTQLTFVLLSITLVFVTFCSVSVLIVLICPGPGGVGRNRRQVDQTKQRAFNTIMMILGALLLNFLGGLIVQVFFSTRLSADPTFVMWCFSWLSVPSMLVLPLLFLHRAGKLTSCKRGNAESA